MTEAGVSDEDAAVLVGPLEIVSEQRPVFSARKNRAPSLGLLCYPSMSCSVRSAIIAQSGLRASLCRAVYRPIPGRQGKHPVSSKMLTLLPYALAVTRSSFPSPLKSPLVTEAGAVPAE